MRLTQRKFITIQSNTERQRLCFLSTLSESILLAHLPSNQETLFFHYQIRYQPITIYSNQTPTNTEHIRTQTTYHQHHQIIKLIKKCKTPNSAFYYKAPNQLSVSTFERWHTSQYIILYIGIYFASRKSNKMEGFLKLGSMMQGLMSCNGIRILLTGWMKKSSS